MCADYIGFGLPPDRFWDLTPRLYIVELDGVARRFERERKDRTELAWQTAMLTRVDKMPRLETLWGQDVAPKQTAIKGVLAVLSQEMPKITLDDWRARLSKKD